MNLTPIPALLYGTAWKKDRTEALVRTALDCGFRGIDTACQPKHYDEAGVGAALAGAIAAGLTRAEVYLQTKFTALGGQDPKRVPYDPTAEIPTQVVQSFEASLRNLRIEYVDCLVLHSPFSDRDDTLRAWQAMEALVDSGRVHRLGISNCYRLHVLEDLHAQARVKPQVVQNRFYAETGYDREIRAYCRTRGLCYQSFWTLTANPALLRDPILVGLARTYRRTPVQILFRYLTLVGVTPLTGTTSVQHMREDLAISEFDLTAIETDALTELL